MMKEKISYICDSCGKDTGIEKEVCEKHEEICKEEQLERNKYAKKLNEFSFNTFSFYAETVDELEKCIYYCFKGYPNLDYEKFKYPSILILREYDEKDLYEEYTHKCLEIYPLEEMEKEIRALKKKLKTKI